MKLKTFYKIFYRHRIIKANFFLKIYLILILPIRYLFNIPFLPKKIDLDKHLHKNSYLFDKKLDFLFEKFNSDKGNFYINQYSQPIKKKILRLVLMDIQIFMKNIFFLKNKIN
tara:strand:+ start:1117 stop:1455 length:339 start_codon:yes stop_codon:yes gene_type:complete